MKQTVITVPEQADLIVHGGIFHADETMVAAIYGKYLEMQGRDTIHVARIPNVAGIPENTTALVADIGYGRYDHHQEGGNGTHESGIPFASAGLVFRDFGKEIYQDSHVYDRMLEYMEMIDGPDNGVFEGQREDSVAYAVGSFEPNQFTDAVEEMKFLLSFMEQCAEKDMTKDEVRMEYMHMDRTQHMIQEAVRRRAQAREEMKQSIIQALNDPSHIKEGTVLMLDKGGPNLVELLEEIAQEGNETAANITHYIHPGMRNDVMVRCMAKEPGTVRLEPDALKIPFVPDTKEAEGCNFVHKDMFMASFNSTENALKAVSDLIYQHEREAGSLQAQMDSAKTQHDIGELDEKVKALLEAGADVHAQDDMALRMESSHKER